MSNPDKRLTAADFDPEVLRLFDRYIHGASDVPAAERIPIQ